jgi:hypothetical protein
MDESKTGTAAAGTSKRPWLCEIELAGTWRQYGQNGFKTAAGVKRSWALQVTAWREGAPAARARNRDTGEIVAM